MPDAWPPPEGFARSTGIGALSWNQAGHAELKGKMKKKQ